MLKKSLIPLALLACMASCNSSGRSSEGDGDDQATDVLTVDMTAGTQKATYDSIVKIPLHLPGDEVVGSCGKVLYHDGHFYMWDRRQNVIWAFDRNGDFAAKLDAVGKGPGEYVRIADFDITPDGVLYVLDPSGQNLLAYSTPDLAHRKTMRMKNRGTKFAMTDSTHVYLELVMGKDSNAKLALWTPADSITSLIEYKIDGEAHAAGSGHLWRSGDKVMYYDAFSPDVYEVTAGGIVPCMSFSSPNFPTDEQIVEMVDERRSNSSGPRRDRSDSPVIRDVRDVYVTLAWTSVNFYTTPPKFMVIDNSNGKLTEIENSERFSGNQKTAYGVADDFFITIRSGNDDEDMSLILYTLRPVQE